MVKAAVILADNVAGLARIYGIPAVRRLVLLAHQLGVDGVHLISRDARLLPAVSDIIGPDAFHHISNEGLLPEVVENLSLDKDDQILVLRANHVIDRWSLKRLLQEQHSQRISILDNDQGGNSEAIYVAKAALLVPLLASMLSSKGLEETIQMGVVHVDACPGLPQLVSLEPGRTKAVEATLIAALAGPTWGSDGILARHVSRPISRIISPGAIRAGLTANAVTLLNAVIGLAGASLLYVGGYLFQVLGSFLFLCSVILDGVDGEVARLTLQESTFGHYLDVICDNAVHVAVFLGIAFGLYHETADPVFLYLLLILLGGFGSCALVFNRTLERHREGLQHPRSIALLEKLFNNRDFAYLVMCLSLVHRLDWFLVGSAFGTYVLSGTLWLTNLRWRASRLPPDAKST